MKFENIEITNENAIEIAEDMKRQLYETFMKSYDKFISNGLNGLVDFIFFSSCDYLIYLFCIGISIVVGQYALYFCFGER